MKSLPILTSLGLCLSLLLPDGAFAMAKRPTARPTPAAEASPPPVAESSPALPEKPPARPAQVVVLGYHRFVENVRHPDTEMTVEEFENQMQQLKDAGISVISMEDFLAWRRGEKNIPERSALLTFDDGWRTQYTRAWPILKKFGYPFTLFIYTDYIKGGPRAGGESMSWQDLEAFRDAGVAIESHTVSHADLRGKRSTRGTPEYAEWLKNELAGSREMLEQRLGIRVRALAVPYGYYNSTVQKAAEEAGYEALFTVNGQPITGDTPSLALGRFILQHKKPEIFQSALRSSGGSGGPGGERPPAVAELTGIAVTPSHASTTEERRPAITANVRSFGKVAPESLNMRLSGVGIVEATFDEKAHTLTHQPKNDLPPGNYTVIVTSESDGKRAEGRWEFTIKGSSDSGKSDQPDSSTPPATSSTPADASGKAAAPSPSPAE